MSSVQYFRELISERLSAAAEEIFAEVEKTILQYEGAMERQRRLVETLRKRKGSAAAPAQQNIRREKRATLPGAKRHKKRRKQQKKLPEPLWIKEEEEEHREVVERIRNGCGGPEEELEEQEEQEEEGEEGEEQQLLLHPETHLLIQFKSRCEEGAVEREEEEEEEEEGGDLQLQLQTHIHIHDEKNHLTDAARLPVPEEQKVLALWTPLETQSPDLDLDLVERPAPSPCSGREDLFSKRLVELVVLKQEPPDIPEPEPEPGPVPERAEGKLLVCPVCDQTFRFRSLLKRHTHAHKGGKRHFCRTCGKGFDQSGDSLAHGRTHVRRRGFFMRGGRSGSLSARMRNHNLWRRFSCRTCGKRFVQSGGLLAHMGVHSGGKPFT